MSNPFPAQSLNQRQEQLQGCTAVILAGGLGTRLRSVVSDRPKPLAIVNGRPFITYLLDQLTDAGLQRVVLCTGYLGEQVVAALGSEWRSLELIYSQEQTPLGTGGAVRQAWTQLQSEVILVMNGDSYCEIDWAALWAQHQLHPQDSIMVVTQIPDVQRFGQVKLNSDGQIIQFEEKGRNSGPGWINAGIYLLPTSELQSMPVDQPSSLERSSLTALASQHRLWGHRSQGVFVDIGLPESYQHAHSVLSSLAQKIGTE